MCLLFEQDFSLSCGNIFLDFLARQYKKIAQRQYKKIAQIPCQNVLNCDIILFKYIFSLAEPIMEAV